MPAIPKEATAQILIGETLDDIWREIKRLSDEVLVLKTKFAIYGAVFAAAGGIIGSIITIVVGGAILWYIKK